MDQVQRSDFSDCKGVWIPANVFFNRDLSRLERDLVVDIHYLESDDRGCCKTNESFAAFHGVGISAIEKALTKPPKAVKDDGSQNDWIISLFLSREPDTRIEYTVLRNLRDIFRDGGDLTPEKREVRVRMEYDWKRMPLNACERLIRNFPHLFFTTSSAKHVCSLQPLRSSSPGRF
jgi:hypothetical protein